jgi:hypothetical protein
MGRRPHLPLLALAPFVLAATAFLLGTGGHLGASIGLDYDNDAAAATSALAHGDLSGVLSHQPLMGLFSVVLRAPFVALAPAANLDAQYLLGLVPCMAVVAALVVVLRREVAARRPGSRARDLLPWLLLFSAPVAEALLYGHPEEPVGAALCVGAALAAMRGRAVLAGLLLGLAVATKQWALFAVLPVLAAGTAGGADTPLRTATVARIATASVAAIVALGLTLPLALGNHEQFSTVSHQAAVAVTPSVTPLNVWAAASPGANPTDTGSLGGFGVPLSAPAHAAGLSRPLMALAVLGAALLAARRRRRAEDVLGLLALVFLARCAFDPVDNVYYHAPFLMSLVAWEALRHGRLPVLSLVSATVLGALALESRLLPDAATLPVVLYLGWAIPLAVALTVAVVRPARLLAAPEAAPSG